MGVFLAIVAALALCLAVNRRGRDKWTTQREREDPPR
jgi:hypothetical protein